MLTFGLGLLLGAASALAQPDYPPAHWVPPVGCTKWYTTGNGHNFCVIHDMEGYYWTSISYLNTCSVSASVYYLVNGLQNGTDSSGHRENNPNDPPAGDITQSVRETNYAWHAICWNRYMFGTEHEGFVSNPVWFSEEMYQASAALHRHLCDTYGIPKDRNHIIGHDEKKNAAWVAWMQANWPAIDPTCNTHTDPGQYWDWNHFMALINAGPTITVQPQSQNVDPGASVTFSVTASGAPPLAYQWRFNAANVTGATTSSFTRANAQLADAGGYSVVVSDQTASVTSSVAVLIVRVPPSIAAGPQSQSVASGQTATFSVTASGAPPLTYQWRFQGSDLPGATFSTWVIPAVGAANAGNYSVLVTNAYGVAISPNASLAIVSALAVGANDFAQVSVPPPVTNAVAVAAGAWHSVALRANGTLVAWGNNGNGQCDVPPGLQGVLAIAAGGYHTLALKADGTVVGWGANDYGQAAVPPRLDHVVAIAAGDSHSLALRADGTVAAWGDNSWGQTSLPAGLTGVAAVAAGGNHSLALKTDGSVVGWGQNADAEGNFAGESSVPWSLSNVVGIAAGHYHSLAVTAGGTVAAWGDNSQGQCDLPVGLAGVVAVAGGAGHSLALKADGSVAAWGADWNGQCQVPSGLTDVVGVAAGADHTLVLLDGTAPVPHLLYPAWNAGQFSAWQQTLYRKNYGLEYMTGLGQTNWTSLPSVPGNGGLRYLSDSSASVPSRFYRVRPW